MDKLKPARWTISEGTWVAIFATAIAFWLAVAITWWCYATPGC